MHAVVPVGTGVAACVGLRLPISVVCMVRGVVVLVRVATPRGGPGCGVVVRVFVHLIGVDGARFVILQRAYRTTAR